MKDTRSNKNAAAGPRPDLGVPGARNARIYALIGLAVTVVVGVFVWDLLGVIFGLPFAALGLVRGAMTVKRTRAYPRDRRAAITAIVVGVAYLALLIPIGMRADRSGSEPVDCGGEQTCLEDQRDSR